MQTYKGLYLPDEETHLIEWMKVAGTIVDEKPTYQYHKYQAALKYCNNRRLAVDVGAHVGLWSRVMALDFNSVVAFEPVPAHIECWRKNLADKGNARLFCTALGETRKMVKLERRTKDSSGDTGISKGDESGNAAVGVSMVPLDDYGLKGVDFLKVDNEGYELFVLKGAEATLLESRPTVIVEQKPGMAQRYGLAETAAVEYLKSLGAFFRKEISGDYILSWEK